MQSQLKSWLFSTFSYLKLWFCFYSVFNFIFLYVCSFIYLFILEWKCKVRLRASGPLQAHVQQWPIVQTLQKACVQWPPFVLFWRTLLQFSTVTLMNSGLCRHCHKPWVGLRAELIMSDFGLSVSTQTGEAVIAPLSMLTVFVGTTS